MSHDINENSDLSEFREFSTCSYADFLSDDAFMDFSIKPLWSDMPRMVGRAFTVLCEAGDNLMVHAAIYQAPPQSVLVINAGDSRFAVAGGNVCATAAEREISGFIIDGVIRDVGEIRDMAFPVYARGNVPKPGKKKKMGEMGVPINCGGITVNNGDIIVADQEGIVVIKPEDSQSILAKVKEKVRNENNQTLKEWQSEHQQKITSILQSLNAKGA
ncbi:RraA family protein [Vibrio penaeicida]|uniref:RraA family protein n=1 Tax=Vibrio penaeicida TaxID=104609 RepID=UPI000CEA4B4C|nr:RraA family protein [Vibrio penaeicida]